MINAMSVDLEDWYHICGVETQQWANEWHKYSSRLERNVDKILHLFDRCDVKATFFVVGYIAEKHPALIKRIADSGHRLAAHGCFHRRIFDMTPEEFEKDLVECKRAIEEASGQTILGYRAPEWSLKRRCRWSLDILKKTGFEYDASANPLSHLSGKYFGIYPHEIETEHGQIFEFPLSTFRCFGERVPFSGGLPLRLVPYFYVRSKTRSINGAGYPVIFYIHPWEFDPEQVKIDLPFNRKFMHYFNTQSTSVKIEALVQQFEFATIEEVLGLEKFDKSASDGNRISIKRTEGAYVGSAILTITVFLGILGSLILISCVIGPYALLLVVVALSICYWPWHIFFGSTGSASRGSSVPPIASGHTEQIDEK